MLVNDWMNSPVITVEASDSMQKAIDLMMQHNIGMLPVMDKGRLVGIVTDRDLKQAAPSSVAAFEIKEILYHLAKVKVEGIMTRDPITLHPDHTVEEAAQVLLANKISGCPVLDSEGDLCGVITKNDLFRAMVAVTGMAKRGVLFGLMVDDRPGSIKEVTDIIRKYDARLVSVMTTNEKCPPGFRNLYVRTFNVNRKHLPELKKEVAQEAKILYVVDLKEDTRESYATSY